MPKLNVSPQSVLCRLEHKDIEDALSRNQSQFQVLNHGMIANFQLQNEYNAKEGVPEISKRDWGLLILLSGLTCLASCDEQEGINGNA